MVDFDDFINEEDEVDYSNFNDIWDSLDQETTHTDLRPTQIESLKLLQINRNNKDLVLKVSTGAGKTVLGLLYLYSHMKEKNKPVVYLCPTVQLVGQVIEEAEKLGINAVQYPKREPFPNRKGILAEAIIVCTYDKMFNAKSTFNRNDVNLRPVALVMDDAHSGLEKIKDKFTLCLDGGDDLFEKIMEIFKSPLEQAYKSHWESLENDDPTTLFEVPYWIWKGVLDDVSSVLLKHCEDMEILFTYGNVKDYLRWCRCVISASGIEIQPIVLPVEKVPAFTECPHRIFMSATLAEDSSLVRDIGCASKAALAPLRPKSDRGLGERMVLVPSLVHRSFDRKWVMDLVSRLAEKHNAVVLTSSEDEANEWGNIGAEVAIGDAVDDLVDKLRDKDSDVGFAAFPQRYDGVDLPDKACRILVIDGLPKGEGVIERYDYEKAIYTSGPQNKVIFKIEQGLGRSVRSHVDYSVIIFSGPELAHYVAKKEVQERMNGDTQAQMKLALRLVEMAITKEEDSEPEIRKRENAIRDMISKCLDRNKGWKNFYSKNVRTGAKLSEISIDKSILALAKVERNAFELACGNQCADAAQAIRHGLNDLEINEKRYGWALSIAANFISEVDPAESKEMQSAAYFKNKSIHAPKGVVSKIKKYGPKNIGGNILKWTRTFDNLNGIFAEIEDIKSKVNFSKHHKIVERGIHHLGKVVGAQSEMPESDYDDGGPDNLWFWGKYTFVIEVKNNKKNTLYKKDAEQLLHSLNWLKSTYPKCTDIIPLTITNATQLSRDSHYPEGTRVLNEDSLFKLISKFEGFYDVAIRSIIPSLDAKAVLGKLNDSDLGPELLMSQNTIGIEKLKRLKSSSNYQGVKEYEKICHNLLDS